MEKRDSIIKTQNELTSLENKEDRDLQLTPLFSVLLFPVMTTYFITIALGVLNVLERPTFNTPFGQLWKENGLFSVP